MGPNHWNDLAFHLVALLIWDMSGPPIEKTTPKGYPPDLTQPSVAPLGGTLLPAPIASLVSTFTQATSFGIRLGTKVGGFAIAGARETTLTSLELTRAAIEAVLTRAGRDVSERRSDELGKAEAESILERSVRQVAMDPSRSPNSHRRFLPYTTR